MTKPNLEQTIALMKAEILRDIAIGRVPKTVESFSELHDYVDANCYGGFADDPQFCPAAQIYDEDMYDFVNDAQNRIDQWLRSTYGAEVLGTAVRCHVDVSKGYYVQTRCSEFQQWCDSLGTEKLQMALDYAEYERSHGAHARVVVRSESVIA